MNSCYWGFSFFLAFSTRVVVAIIFFTFPPAELPSATPQPQVLQLHLRPVNESNQKVLSRAIHVIFSLPKIDGVVCEISSKEHEGPSSLLLKAPHTKYIHTWYQSCPCFRCTTITKCFTAVLLYVMFWWWVDGILLLLLYSCIITVSYTHLTLPTKA